MRGQRREGRNPSVEPEQRSSCQIDGTFYPQILARSPKNLNSESHKISLKRCLQNILGSFDVGRTMWSGLSEGKKKDRFPLVSICCLAFSTKLGVPLIRHVLLVRYAGSGELVVWRNS